MKLSDNTTLNILKLIPLFIYKPLDSIQYTFKDCSLDFSSVPDQKYTVWTNFPIRLMVYRDLKTQPIGGVKFENVTLKTNTDRRPINFSFFQGKRNPLRDITGTILVDYNGKTTPFDLGKYVEDLQEQVSKVNTLQPAALELDKLHAPASMNVSHSDNTFYPHDKFTFLQYAKKGEKVTINVTVQTVYGKGNVPKIELKDPSGKTLEAYTVPDDKIPFPVTFTAKETGVYRLVNTQKFTARIDVASTNPGSGILVKGGMDFIPKKGKLYFEVPTGVKEFFVEVGTNTVADVALVNPAGKEVQRKHILNSFHVFTATRADASQSEIWHLDVPYAK